MIWVGVSAMLTVSIILGCDSLTIGGQIEAIQKKAVEICQYLPEYNTVSAILAAGNPQVTGVAAIANAICLAVMQWKGQAQQHAIMDCPRVNGVCVSGSFQ